MALTDKLTAIADAIRSKTGTSESLTLDAMVTAIDGISAGITPTGDINITENGEFDVTEFAKAIVNVASGSENFVVETGSFTVDADTYTKQTINHSLGTRPFFACCMIKHSADFENSIASSGHTQVITVLWDNVGAVRGGVRSGTSKAAAISYSSSLYTDNLTDTTVAFDPCSVNFSYYHFFAGITYHWVVVGIKEG